MNPFAALDATDQARLVKRREVSPTELVTAAIEAVEAVNPTLNAVIHERFERALGEAANMSRTAPFAGVPIVLKDLDGTLADEPYHAGTKHLRLHGYRANATSELFARLQAAGFIVIAKTNTPEFGLVPTTEPESYGPTRNPWNRSHSTGGSSGGSAAAVASGMVAVGHAGDGGGSIRIPASECGLVGLKPTRGRIPLGPVETEAWGGLVARLVLTRSVRDTAAILDAVSAPRLGEVYGAPQPERPYVAELNVAHRQLRIGYTTQSADGTPTDPEVAASIERTAQVLASLGHHVTEAAPRQIGDEAFFAELSGHFLGLFPVWTAQSVDELESLTGVAATPETVEPATWALAEAGRAISGVDFANSMHRLRQRCGEIEQWWAEGFDLLLTATIPELPPTLGQFGATEDNPLNGIFRATPIVANTMPFNMTGQPAMSVPATPSSSGLPIGAQLIAAFGRDDLAVRVAAELEVAQPWADRRPEVWAG
ncbi:MAG: amidase [Microthrixaceae bacterium]|nr:amidase [Microthrixaceae bacterium]